MEDFNQYFKKEVESNPQKLYYCYLGIKKADFPKWEGWKIIDIYKQNGVHITNISNHRLDQLTENFYREKYLKLIIDQSSCEG